MLISVNGLPEPSDLISNQRTVHAFLFAYVNLIVGSTENPENPRRVGVIIFKLCSTRIEQGL